MDADSEGVIDKVLSSIVSKRFGRFGAPVLVKELRRVVLVLLFVLLFALVFIAIL
jgi:hypothetical protein